MEITKEIIEEAKEIAKQDYVKRMIKLNCHNPSYERKWLKYTYSDKEWYVFALEGTPDKAFVMVYPDKVIAKRQDFSIIKVWK